MCPVFPSSHCFAVPASPPAQCAVECHMPGKLFACLAAVAVNPKQWGTSSSEGMV